MKLFGNARTQFLLIKELSHDPYLIRKIPTNSMGFFVDIGAQAGVVSVMFRLWNRHTRMYAVEPDPVAYGMLKDNVSNLDIITLNKALGDGSSFALNPPEKRTTLGVEYVKAEEGFDNLTKSERLTDLLTELNKQSTVDIKPSETMFKIDCEGGEAYIVDHEPSLAILKEARLIAFELHRGRRTLEEYFSILEKNYSDTHNIIKIKQNKDRSANWTLIRKDVTLG
jgi:FkbM family methyltransferase